MNNETPEQLETRLKMQYSAPDIKRAIQEELDDIKELIEEVNELPPYAWTFKVC